MRLKIVFICLLLLSNFLVPVSGQEKYQEFGIIQNDVIFSISGTSKNLKETYPLKVEAICRGINQAEKAFGLTYIVEFAGLCEKPVKSTQVYMITSFKMIYVVTKNIGSLPDEGIEKAASHETIHVIVDQYQLAYKKQWENFFVFELFNYYTFWEHTERTLFYNLAEGKVFDLPGEFKDGGHPDDNPTECLVSLINSIIYEKDINLPDEAKPNLQEAYKVLLKITEETEMEQKISFSTFKSLIQKRIK